MSNHSGTIHTVRFSPNGRYLASGADDKIVCVYMLDSNPPTHTSTFGRFGFDWLHYILEFAGANGLGDAMQVLTRHLLSKTGALFGG